MFKELKKAMIKEVKKRYNDNITSDRVYKQIEIIFKSQMKSLELKSIITEIKDS